MPRIYVTLKPEEFDGLRLLATEQDRDPRRQGARLIRERLQDLGVLEKDTTNPNDAAGQPELVEAK